MVRGKVIFCMSLCLFLVAPIANSEEFQIKPVDTAWIQSGNPTGRTGGGIIMRAGYDGRVKFQEIETYLKFDLSHIMLSEGDKIIDAYLKLTPVNDAELTLSIFTVLDNNWSSESICWDKKPKRISGVPSDTLKRFKAYEPQLFRINLEDINEAFRNDKIFSVCIKRSGRETATVDFCGLGHSVANPILVVITGSPSVKRESIEKLSETIKSKKTEQPQSTFVESKIVNGGFEDGFKGWKCSWFYGMLCDDAHTGNKAAKLIKTANIQFDRLVQEIKVKKGYLYKIQFWSKSKNTLGICLVFDTQNLHQPLIEIPGAQTERWEMQEGYFVAPNDIIHLQFRAFGPEGYFLVDDVSIEEVIMQETQTSTKGKNSAGRLYNIAPNAIITSIPWIGYPLKYMVDGDIDTATHFRNGYRTGGIYIFSFPEPVLISKIRINQTQADAYEILGDTNGDGKYDKIIVRYVKGVKLTEEKSAKIKTFDQVEAEKAGWIEHNFTPVWVHKLKFKAIAGDAGYLTAYPSIKEFEIYADKDIEVKYKPRGPAKAKLTIDYSKPLPELRPAQSSILKGVIFEGTADCGALWNNGFFKSDETIGKKFADEPSFKNLMGILKELNIDHVWFLNPIMYGDPEAKFIYPTFNEIRGGFKRDILQEIVDAFREGGIKVSLLFYPWEPFYKEMYKHRWKYPTEEPSRTGQQGEFPSVIAGDHFKNTFSKMIVEAVRRDKTKQGLDMIHIIPDEYYYKGHSLGSVPDEYLVKKFAEKYKYPTLPARAENSEHYRKWVLFNYEGIAELTKYFNDIVKRNYPGITTIAMFSQMPICTNNRIDHGIAYDIIAHTSKVDWLYGNPYLTHVGFANHYYPTETAIILKAASPNRKSGIVPLIGHYWEGGRRLRPVEIYGTILSAVMNGARAITAYRGNYFFVEKELFPYVKRVFKMLDELDAWGIDKAEIPKKIAVLSSRAGEDWWWIKAQSEGGSPERGVASGQFILEYLLQNGLPFEFYYLDYPEDLKDISQFKLIILPFPYSIPQKSYQIIKDAVERGVKLLVLQCKGETDEFGNPYQKPLLEMLINDYPERVTFLPENILEYHTNPNYTGLLKTKILQALGNERPLYFDTDQDVEVTMLEKSFTEKVVLIINWEKKDIEVNLGVNMPKGKYELIIMDLKGKWNARMNDKPTVTEHDLSNFSIKLLEGEAMLLFIRQVTDI